MSAFEIGLREARARQRRIFLLLLGAFILAATAVVAVLVSASGTSIKILPADAGETGSVQVTDGFAFSLENIVYGFSQAPEITVRADGFREARIVITPEQQGGAVEVTLEELPGRLIAMTDPARTNTRWDLNGAFLAVAESLEQELDPGSYQLSIDNPFFEVEDFALQIERDKTHETTVLLRPVKGRLELTSKPEGADVRLDGLLLGQTPLTLEQDGGEYELTVEKKDFVAVTETIALTNQSRSITRNYLLKPVSATVTFSVSPPGGQLLLNGGQIDPNRSHGLSANTEHRVTYALEGYTSVTRKLALKPRESRHLTFELEPALGQVEIYTAPAADILVDGKKVGKGSVKLSLRARPHEIELKKTGYRSVKTTIRPSVGRKTVVRRNLVPEASARLAEAPKSYRNKAGIELLLFRPGPFTMGAPRHQKGQRANEFLRDVRLEKPFYAAKHEVTNAQFALFRAGHSGPGREPVTSITWLEAATFCNWLSAQNGLSPFYQIKGGRLRAVNSRSDGYRLLSEAEWEWLARKAGKASQTIFPWGDESVVPPMAGNIADESANGVTRFYVANYTDGYTRIAPVGSFKAEASGLYDLAGNVSEWVHDVYSLAPPSEGVVAVDPLGPGFGGPHVIKGASWGSGTRTQLRASFRDGLAGHRNDVGFRVGRYLYGGQKAAAD